MQNRIKYTQQPDNVEAIKEFIGGEFPPCPDCDGTGTIDDNYGGHDCIFCVSRLLPILVKGKVVGLDWDDTIVKELDGTFTIIQGENWK